MIWYQRSAGYNVAEYIEYLVAYFNLCPTANEFAHCSPFLNDVLKGIDKLPIGLHAVHISDQCFCPNKNLSRNCAIINCGCIGVHSISCHWFIALMYVECRKARLEMLPEWQVFDTSHPA